MRIAGMHIGIWVRRSALLLAGLVMLGASFAFGYGSGFLKFRSMMTKANQDIGRIVASEGLDEARFITLGGVRQWIRIRAQDENAPILLFLHGGPGGAISSIAYSFQRPWEDDYVVVQWDQRGAGRSAIDGEDALRGTLSKEQIVADAIDLLSYLNKRFDRKVTVVGQSWGSVLGIEVAGRRPDLVQAYVGIGQMTAWEPTFEESRRLLLQLAEDTGDTELASKMASTSPAIPPTSEPEARQSWRKAVMGEIYRRGYSWHNFQGPGTSWSSRTLALWAASPDVTNREFLQRLMGRTRPLPADVMQETDRSVSGWSVREDVGSRFDVPVFLVSGRYDWQVPVTLAQDFYDDICAPYKMWVEFPHSAHAFLSEEPGRLGRLLAGPVKQASLGQVPAGVEKCDRQ